MAQTNFLRYEEKYRITKAQYNKIKPLLLEHMNYDDYCTGGKHYSIYNIYFDDTNDTVIINSLSKPYYKEKLRARSYKEINGQHDLVFLEMKKKINGIVSKRRIVIPLRDVNKVINHQEIMVKDKDKQKYLELKNYIDHHELKPKVYLRYDRIAFFGKTDKSFRITFDFNITTRRNDVSLESPSYGEKILDDDQMIMEIKISNALPLWLVRFLSENKIYPASYSKYGNEYKKHIQYNQNKERVII